MAGARIELQSAALERALLALRAALKDVAPLLAELGQIVVGQALDSFEDEAGPDGAPWAASQRAILHGGQTLADSGLLRSSIQNEVEIMPDAVIVGSSRVYAAIHQFGGRAGRGHAVTLPARPFLPDEKTVAMAEIEAAITRHFAKAGL